MDKNKEFKDNVDSWIRQIRGEFAEFEDIPFVVDDNCNDIQEMYKLIYEMKDKIIELEQEINALKLIQIVSLKLMEKGVIKYVQHETIKEKY